MLLVKGPNVMHGYLGPRRRDGRGAPRRLVRDRRHRRDRRGRLHPDHRPAEPVRQDRRRDGPARRGRGDADRDRRGRRGGHAAGRGRLGAGSGAKGERLVVVHTRWSRARPSCGTPCTPPGCRTCSSPTATASSASSSSQSSAPASSTSAPSSAWPGQRFDRSQVLGPGFSVFRFPFPTSIHQRPTTIHPQPSTHSRLPLQLAQPRRGFSLCGSSLSCLSLPSC